MVPLALVKILATRWRYLHWLQMWSPGGTTCISCKFDQLGEAPCISCKSDDQVAPPALVQNLVFRWRHFDCVQCWPPGCITCIATLPWIALLALSVSIELASSSARVSKRALTQFQTSRPKVYLSPIKMSLSWGLGTLPTQDRSCHSAWVRDLTRFRITEFRIAQKKNYIIIKTQHSQIRQNA